MASDRRMKVARMVEIALGLFFLISAGMKAMNVDGFGLAISAYGVIKDPTLVRVAAYGALAVEAILGGAFLTAFRFKNLTFIGSTLLTLVFSGLILYAWQVNGLEDCGCFGDYIKMNPPQSLAKNAVLIAIIIATAYGVRNRSDEPFKAGLAIRMVARFGVGLVAGIMIFANLGQSEAPGIEISNNTDKDIAIQISLNGEEIDLSVGEHLVVFLNTECDHCMASVPGLNELDGDATLPPMIALMLGDEDKLDTFLIETEATFRMKLMGQLNWASYIKTAPPIMYFVSEGMFEETWEWEDEPPTSAEVSAATGSE